MKKILYYAFALIIAAAGVAIGSRGCSGRDGVVYVDTISDTLMVYDTVRVITPHSSDSVVVRYEYVALPTAPIDTATGTDSTVVELPIEQRHYSDTCYDVWVSGYRPTLDSLHIYASTTTILQTHTITETKWRTRRWGLSVGAGISVTPRGVEPGIFIGATYTFLSW